MANHIHAAIQCQPLKGKLLRWCWCSSCGTSGNKLSWCLCTPTRMQESETPIRRQHHALKLHHEHRVRIGAPMTWYWETRTGKFSRTTLPTHSQRSWKSNNSALLLVERRKGKSNYKKWYLDGNRSWRPGEEQEDEGTR